MNDITQRILYALGSRGLPSPISGDNQNINIRSSRYGDLYTVPIMRSRHAAAAEASYFIAHNATNDAAATIAGHPAPVLVGCRRDDDEAVHPLRMDPAANLVRGYLDFIEIEVITAGATGTADSWAAQLDTGATRVTTAGTVLTRVNPNMQQSGNVPLLACQAGAITVGAEARTSASSATASSGRRSRSPATSTCSSSAPTPSRSGRSLWSPPARSRATSSGCRPSSSARTDQFLLALYSPAQSAAGVYKVRMGWWER
jgi:hypothetical protein